VPLCNLTSKFKVWVNIIFNLISGVKVGDRVVWLREPPQSNESGIVKWIGNIESEEIAGIEFVSGYTLSYYLLIKPDFNFASETRNNLLLLIIWNYFS